MDAGIAAVLGAVVGSLGTAIAAGVTGFFARSQAKMQIEAQHRQAERQIRADHVGQLREHRRQAYVEFATQAADHLKQLEAASQAFAADPYSEEEALALLPAEQQFTDPAYNSAYARLCMEGPEDVAYVAASIGGALADASGAGLAWALKHRGGTPTDCPDPQGALEAAISTTTTCATAASGTPG
ncbi:hypothetical protein [Streptomyces iakyrus]|uniref:hypothetical protein n=1 Tax=Streptomyces iakyrus TaxID=68219 RepID=UPI003D8AAFE1